MSFPQITFAAEIPCENDTSYGKIIDAFRLRIEDDYVHGLHNHGLYNFRLRSGSDCLCVAYNHGIWDPFDDSLPCFEDFLDRCDAIGSLLMPTWWNAETRAKCRRLALKPDGDHFIGHAVEKHDVQDFWKDDDSIAIKLRMLAEDVYGGGYGLGQYPMPKGYQCFCGV